MAIDRSFNDMLLDYVPESLLKNEVVKKDWFLSNVQIVDGWAGGSMEVAFKEAAASSIAYGALTAESDIGQSVLVRGSVAGHKHVSSSMIFNQRDLIEHTGSNKISKKSFLKILPDEINDHTQILRDVVSSNLLNGKKLAKATANGTAGGVLEVDRPERLQVGMKLELHDTSGVTTDLDVYVTAIDLGTRQITVSATRGGAALDISAFTTANSSYLTMPGADSAAFSGLKDMLLSAANGGDSALFGKTKTAYSYLQSYNHSGSAITSTNILKPIFDAYNTHRRFYTGNAKKIVMSFKNLAAVMAEMEASKGAFNVVPGSRKQSAYGYDEATIIGVGGGVLEIVAVNDLDDDVILGLDMSAFKFHTNGLIRRIKSPEGLEYFTKRATTGYQYILDHELYGELVLNAPQKCFIIHSISF